MSFPVIHSAGETGAVLGEALDRRTPLVLSFRGSRGWNTFKSRILKLDKARAQMSLELGADQGGAPARQLQEGQYVGVAFRRGHKKCLCACVVADTAADKSTAGRPEGLTLHWPKEIQVLQRRDYYRVPVPHNMEIKALFWPGGLGDKPENPGQDRSSLYAPIVDISLGGMAVRLPGHEQCLFREGQTVSCEFAVPQGGSISLEAHFRHGTRKPSGEQLLGFQFIGLEHGPEGRQRIRQLVGLTHQLTHRSRPPFRRGLSRRRESV